MHCLPEQTIDAGEHYIVLCRVVDLELARSTEPLIFCQGGYGAFRGHSGQKMECISQAAGG